MAEKHSGDWNDMYVDYLLKPDTDDKVLIRGLAKHYAEACNAMAGFARRQKFCTSAVINDYVRECPELFSKLPSRYVTLAVSRVMKELSKNPDKKFTEHDHVDMDERLVSIRTVTGDITHVPGFVISINVGACNASTPRWTQGRIFVPFVHKELDDVDMGEGNRVILRREKDGWHVYARVGRPPRRTAGE